VRKSLKFHYFTYIDTKHVCVKDIGKNNRLQSDS